MVTNLVQVPPPGGEAVSRASKLCGLFARAFGMDHCVFLAPSAAPGEWVLAGSGPHQPGLMPAGTRIDARRAPAMVDALERLRSDPRASVVASPLGPELPFVAQVPAVQRGRLIGVVGLACGSRERLPGPHGLALAERMAAELGIALGYGQRS